MDSINRLTTVSVNGTEYDTCLSIESCDRIEAKFRQNLEKLWVEMVSEGLYRRDVVAFVIAEGLQYASNDVPSYQDVRKALHQTGQKQLFQWGAVAADLIYQAFHDDVIPVDDDESVDESGESKAD